MKLSTNINNKINTRLSEKERVYILPNKNGFIFLLNIFILFNIGNIYGNNFILLLAFILFAIFVIIIFQTHFSLVNFKINKLSIINFFETKEELNNIEFNLNSDFGQKIELYLYDNKNKKRNISLGHIKAREQINNNSILHSGLIRFAKLSTGQYNYSKIKINSIHPSNLLYSWKYESIPINFYIYPKRTKPSNDICNQFEFYSANPGGSREQDFFSFKKIDEKIIEKEVDWKTFAKRREFYTKVYNKKINTNILLEKSIFKNTDINLIKEYFSYLISHHYKNSLPLTVKIENKIFENITTKKEYEECLKTLTDSINL